MNPKHWGRASASPSGSAAAMATLASLAGPLRLPLRDYAPPASPVRVCIYIYIYIYIYTYICVGRARCGAGTGCSAIKYQSKPEA